MTLFEKACSWNGGSAHALWLAVGKAADSHKEEAGVQLDPGADLLHKVPVGFVVFGADPLQVGGCIQDGSNSFELSHSGVVEPEECICLPFQVIAILDRERIIPQAVAVFPEYFQIFQAGQEVQCPEN